MENQENKKQEANEYEVVDVDLGKLQTTILSESGPNFPEPVTAVIVSANYAEYKQAKKDDYGAEYHGAFVVLHMQTKIESKVVDFEQRLSGLYNYGDSIRIGKKSYFKDVATKFREMFSKQYSDDLKVLIPAFVGKKVMVKTITLTVAGNDRQRHQIMQFLPNEGI